MNHAKTHNCGDCICKGCLKNIRVTFLTGRCSACSLCNKRDAVNECKDWEDREAKK
jgi:hypothetical protein